MKNNVKIDEEFSSPFPLNIRQQAFLKKYNPDRDCIVDTPAGTNKTGIIYIATRKFLSIGQSIVVAAPTEALAKDLYNAYVGIFGIKLVAMDTGRNNKTSKKFIIITTPKGYLSAYNSGKKWTKAGLLIIDEADNLFDLKKVVSGVVDVDVADKAFDLAAILLVCRNFGRLLMLSGKRSRELAQIFESADLIN